MFSLIWIGRIDDIYDPCFLQYELPFYYPGQVSYFAHSLSLEQSLSLSLSLSLLTGNCTYRSHPNNAYMDLCVLTTILILEILST